MVKYSKYIYYTGWWFQTFFMLHNIWDNPSHWLICFKMIKTTNQYIYIYIHIHGLTVHLPVTHEVLNYARKVASSGGVKYVKRFSHWDQRKSADWEHNKMEMQLRDAKRFFLLGIKLATIEPNLALKEEQWWTIWVLPACLFISSATITI